MRIILTVGVLLLFLLYRSVHAQPDQTPPARKFDVRRLEQLKNDNTLKYEAVPDGISLWKRFLNKLRQVIATVIYTATSTDWTRVLILGLIIVALLYVVMRVLHIDTLKIFYRNSAVAVLQTLAEDIQAANLDALLGEALQKQDYRLAIRVQFLRLLRLLSERGLIRWESGKTTREYLAEVSSSELRADLRTINRYFEYTWYGNFPATPGLYEEVANVYRNWKDRF